MDTANQPKLTNPIANVQIFEVPKKPNFLSKFIPSWIFSGKVIFIILGFVIIAELYIAYQTFTTDIPSVTRFEAASDAKIILLADQKSYQIDDEILLTVRLATGGYPTDGTDLVLKYDPAVIEPRVEGFFEEGLVYAEYTQTELDRIKGELRVSGITATNDDGFVGVGTFGTVFMTAKKTGRTTISVEFKNGETVDTNVIQSRSAKDLLTTVYNLDLDISNQSAEKETPKNSCEKFLQVCFDDEGQQGVQECKLGRVSNNACVYDPYLTESCDECLTQ